MSNDDKVLQYVGEGASLPNVPAMDLTQAMIDETGVKSSELIATGLYKPVSPKSKPSPTENKMVIGATENKKEE